MEVSAKNTSFASWHDSLEIEYKFSLPEGTLFHDAWLWMDNIPVQAKLYEKEKARFIYESLVKRNIDPLIIYKNENETYEARIFPVLDTTSRKVKFNLLIPVKANSKAIELPLPLSIFRSDLTGNIPNIELEIINNSSWGNPKLWTEANNISSIGNSTYATLTGTTAILNSTNDLYFENYSRDGFFVTTETAPDEGYYQIMLPADDTFAEPQHVIFTVDYINSFNTNYQEIWKLLKTKINYELNKKDSFNIIYANNGMVQSASSNWIPADSGSVNTTFNAIGTATTNNSNLNREILLKAIQFNNTMPIKGSIFLLTNEKSPFSGPTQANNKLNELIDSMQELMPVNVMHFETGNVYDFPLGNTYTINNEYFLTNLSTLTNGFYFKRYYIQTNTYYYGAKSLNNIIDICFSALQPKHVFNQVNYSYDGVLTDNYKVPNSVYSNQRDAYLEVGKYYLGTGSLQIQKTYKIGGTVYQKQFILNSQTDNSDLIQKMWGGNFIKRLEQLNTTELYTADIVHNSLNYNVLSTKTAFLALETDTVAYRINNNPTIAIDNLNANKLLNIEAIPNPFNNIQKIKIDITQGLQNKEWQLNVCDISGRIIHTQSGNSSNKNILLISWNGSDLNPGIYFLTFKLDTFKTTLKIIKQ